ncbi:DUF3662 and FHA domain-containing protein [Glutamicibacter endophyticus]
MGFFDNVERGLEKVVTGFFRGNSTAEIKPVELTTALRNQMDRSILAISEGRSLAPNSFTVALNQRDFETAKSWSSVIVQEIATVTADHASSQGYNLQGEVRIRFTLDDELRPGEREISADFQDVAKPAANPAPAPRPAAKPAPQPQANPATQTVAQPRPVPHPPAAPVAKQAIVEVAGERYAVHHHSIVLGRSNSSDIPVDDAGVSRQHVRIETHANEEFTATDLGSTNGTYIDGKKISSATQIFDGTVITIGQTKIIFRLITPKQGGAA